MFFRMFTFIEVQNMTYTKKKKKEYRNYIRCSREVISHNKRRK